MNEFLLTFVGIGLFFVGWQLMIISSTLIKRHTPVARNEEAVLDGANEPEPKRGR